MPDPVATEIAGGTASSAIVTPTFTARTAGELLVLSVASDDYRLTTGTNRPESSGWTFLDGQQGNLGCYVWWKTATGGETSVSYEIGSGTLSAYTVVSATEIDASPLGVFSSNQSTVSPNKAAHTTPSVTPAAGSTWLVVATVGSTGNVTAGPYTWTAPFVEASERYNTTGYRPGVTVATRLLAGGVATSATATFTGTTSDQGMGIIAAFRQVPPPQDEGTKNTSAARSMAAYARGGL